MYVHRYVHRYARQMNTYVCRFVIKSEESFLDLSQCEDCLGPSTLGGINFYSIEWRGTEERKILGASVTDDVQY
jgi:hypothetical protein